MIQFPPDAVMTALHNLTCALAVHIFEDESGIEVKMLVPSEEALIGREWVLLADEVLSELERRRWVILPGETELEVTKDGAYWCERWLKEKAKEQRKRRCG